MAKVTTLLQSFQWEGMNAAGQPIKGVLESQSLAQAKVALRKQGVIVKRINKRESLFLIEKIKKLRLEISRYLAVN